VETGSINVCGRQQRDGNQSGNQRDNIEFGTTKGFVSLLRCLRRSLNISISIGTRVRQL